MYRSVEDFKKLCTLFTAAEKAEIIEEAESLDINVLEYIEFEIEGIRAVQRDFNNQKSLI